MRDGYIHHTSLTDDEHFANLRKILKGGDSYFLIGGVISRDGVRPVTFTSGVPVATVEIVDAMSTPLVNHILDVVQEASSPRGKPN
jgi:hypothetical protein